MKFTDIQDAFFFVSSAGYGMHTAILEKNTGQIYYRSEMGDLDEISDMDINGAACIEIPHKNDLGLGRELVFEYVDINLLEEYDRVRGIFQSRGAYSRFKSLLQSKGLLDSWYTFEDQREEQALREWCAGNRIQLSE